MATNYGTSLSCVSDLICPGRLVTGRRAIGEAIARRLQTPRGGLLDDPDYGYDLRGLVNGDVDTSFLSQIGYFVSIEAEKDERVGSASASVTFLNGALSVRMMVTTAEGPFTLVLSVNDVTVEVLSTS